MSTRFIDHLLVGIIADRPAATAVPAGTLYSSTDEAMIYQSDGTNWDDWPPPSAAPKLAGDDSSTPKATSSQPPPPTPPPGSPSAPTARSSPPTAPRQPGSNGRPSPAAASSPTHSGTPKATSPSPRPPTPAARLACRHRRPRPHRRLSANARRQMGRSRRWRRRRDQTALDSTLGIRGREHRHWRVRDRRHLCRHRHLHYLRQRHHQRLTATAVVNNDSGRQLQHARSPAAPTPPPGRATGAATTTGGNLDRTLERHRRRLRCLPHADHSNYDRQRRDRKSASAHGFTCRTGRQPNRQPGQSAWNTPPAINRLAVIATLAQPRHRRPAPSSSEAHR